MSSNLWSTGELRSLVALAEAQFTAAAIAEDLDRDPADIQRVASAIRIVLLPRRDVCPNCGIWTIKPGDGWCARCVLDAKAARWREEDEREAAIQKQIAREDARERKRRERRREKTGTNPRKGKTK